MGAGYSKREVEILGQLQKSQSEAEANRKTIESWQEHVRRHMQDADAHRQVMAAKLVESQQLLNTAKVEARTALTAMQSELDKMKSMVADIQQIYGTVPRPPTELVNIHDTLIDLHTIASAEIQRYKHQFKSMAKVYVWLTNGTKKQVMDDEEYLATSLIRRIHDMIKTRKMPVPVPVQMRMDHASSDPPGGAVIAGGGSSSSHARTVY